MLKGYDLSNLKQEPIKELIPLCKKAGSEGCVLLKNEDNVLPLFKDNVSVFGRIQYEHYKSGTGSGGMVNVQYTTNIISALRTKSNIKINEELAEIYKEWILQNPFDKGCGWGTEPWSQKEMELTDELVKAAREKSNKAVIVIGRTAGEDKDNSETKGSYLLSDTEESMLDKVTKYFEDVCVVLNVGNVIDMNWVLKYGIKAVLYAWHGGQEGGNAVADILCGDVTPSGKLSDTIAKNISDYPAYKNFGEKEESVYQEDIYVGYRYFETFKKDCVLYPFGFGLSYTDFDIDYRYYEKDGKIEITAEVENIGNYSGKEVIEVYYSAPFGAIGRPDSELIGFAKTKELLPKEKDTVKIQFYTRQMSTFDDSGATGNVGCWVMEAGEYKIFAGTSVRDKKCVGTYTVPEITVTQKLKLALLPNKKFDRIKPVLKDNKVILGYEPTPFRSFNIDGGRNENLPKEYAQTGDKGIKLKDVKDGKATIEEFIAQLSDKDLCCIVRGEGMSSPKVTAGTGCAFGGVTDRLESLGIPIMCGSDGPSGIRMDSGAKATSLPNGTLFACTWNRELIEEIFTYEGIELAAYNIDLFLGPGMNIHRHILNGRNFEYFSEDPYLSGMIASAMVNGMNKSNSTAVIKHLACNSQECGRHRNDSVVSERALREIYLKGFEICIKNSNVRAIMTSYNRINGVWAANNYAFATEILRNEWGFCGIVITDWWAKMNPETGDEGTIKNMKYFARSQNDVYMVCESSENRDDNLELLLESGEVTRGELQRNAMNICRFAIGTNAMERKRADTKKKEYKNIVFSLPIGSQKMEFDIAKSGDYQLSIMLKSSGSELSQRAIMMLLDSDSFTATIKGGNEWRNVQKEAHLEKGKHTLEIVSVNGLEIGKLEIKE